MDLTMVEVYWKSWDVRMLFVARYYNCHGYILQELQWAFNVEHYYTMKWINEATRTSTWQSKKDNSRELTFAILASW